MTTPDLDKIATPRTDEHIKQAQQWHGDMWASVMPAFARTLERELIDWKCRHVSLQECLTALRAAVEQKEREVASLQAENAEPRKDRERLDAVVSHGWKVVLLLGGGVEIYERGRGLPSWTHPNDFRAAIDAALQTGGQKGNPQPDK